MAASLTALYVPIVEYCSGIGRSVGEVQSLCTQRTGHEFHVTYIRTKLNAWTDCGALRMGRGVPAEGARTQALYYATAKAFDPLTLSRAGVEPEAIEVHAQHPSALPARRDHLAVIHEPIGPDELFSETRPQAKPQPNMNNPAGTLFTGQFRPDGVLISYEQFHYVVALLEMMREQHA